MSHFAGIFARGLAQNTFYILAHIFPKAHERPTGI
jgi:hypothetical protein